MKTFALAQIFGAIWLGTIAPPAAAETSATAVSRPAPQDRLGEGWWADRHRAILASIAAGADPEVLLIGDSITNNYDKANPPNENFRPTWDRFYAPRHAMNLGFSGDTTDNVLWRLAHGEVAGLHPKVVVLLIGTNDTGSVGHRDAARTEAGIDAVVADLKRRLPDTHILLVGILPSVISDAKSRTDAAINADLARRYERDPRVTTLDIGSIFRRTDGSVDPSLFYDPRLPQHGAPLHPDTQGQTMMAEAIEPTLAALLHEPPRVALDAMTDVNTALIPVPRLERDSYDWDARHDAERALARTLRPRIVLIGDSITHFWSGPPVAARASGRAAWAHAFCDAPVANLGFGWDRTQNVLWRLDHGEFVGMAPDWVVINIGTNNLTGTANARANTPAETAAGVAAIVAKVQARAPGARIALMAIFPRGERADDPLRRAIDATNQLLAARFADRTGIVWIDIGHAFLTADGGLDHVLLPDGTHPNAAGYERWAQALRRAGVRRS